MPALGAALVTSRIALTTLLERTLSAAVEAVDIATVALAANNNGLVAAPTMVAPGSILNGHRQSVPGSSGLIPDEVRYFTRLCENTVGDAASVDRQIIAGVASVYSASPSYQLSAWVSLSLINPGANHL